MRALFPKNNFVPPKMGSGLRLTVAEAPGEDEALQGEPLVGGSGRMFDSLCRKAGVKREDLTLVNTINCRPPDNVYPTDDDARSYISQADGAKSVQHCMAKHVWPLINGKPWTRIDALGDKALQELTGEKGISYWRGSPLPLRGEEKTRVIPTLHPSYVSRDQSMIPVVVNDLKKNTLVPPEYYNLTPSLADLQAFTAEEFAFDIETKWGDNKQITLVGLCAKPYHVIVVPFSGNYIAELKRIFAGAKTVFGQNILKFDLPILKDNGVEVSSDCQLWDTQLIHHLLFPQFSGEGKSEGDERKSRKAGGGHGLEFIASQFTNKPAWKEVGRGGEGYWERRNAIDTDVTLQAGKTMLAMLRQEQMVDLYNLVQHPLSLICHQMQEIGIKRDPARLKKVRDELIATINSEELKLPDSIRGYDKIQNKRTPAPEGYLNEKGKPAKFIYVPTSKRVSPWRSPKKFQHFLYYELGLPEQKHPKTKKVTTDKGAVEKCIRIARKEGNLLAVAGLQAYQKVKKAATLISSFVKDDMVGGTDREHPRFNVHGTSSGRLSSADPNFQNQPEKARYMYVPDHQNWKFIECISPETRLLTKDLTWKRADEIQVGDSLIGFDENGNRRRIRKTIVEQASEVFKPLYEIVTDKGTIRASDVHSWLRKSLGKTFAWTPTKELKTGDELAFLVRPWEVEHSYDAGWLGGKQTERATVKEIRYLSPNSKVIAIQTSTHTFVAEGFLTHNCDYSNIEPRLTAYFANDRERLARFAQPGYNDHKYTTSIFFDIPYNEVIKDNDKDAPYGKAKRINNGLNYGMGALKIANTFDLDFKEVKELVFKWKTLNAETEQWQRLTAERARLEGFLTTPFGRKRWFYTNSYFTESLSFLPQSSAADIIFRAMLGLMYERINWPFEKVSKVVQIVEPLPKPCRLHLSVHDSLLFGCPGDLVDEAVSVIKRVLEQPWPELSNTVIPIDVKVSEKSWAECDSYKPPSVVLPAAA